MLDFRDKQQRNWSFLSKLTSWTFWTETKKLVFQSKLTSWTFWTTTNKLVFSEQTDKLDLLDRNREIGLSEQINKLDLLDKQQTSWCCWQTRNKQVLLNNNNNNKNLIIYSRLRLSFQTCQHTCRPPCLHPRPRPGVKKNKICTIRTDDDRGCYVPVNAHSPKMISRQ